MIDQPESTVSVIVPSYNGERYLAEAIESVLNQSYRSFELIVVDDGSTDGTRAVAERYEGTIKYIYQDNQGTSAARNTGIEVARGEYFGFLDDDDVWLPEKLTLQMEVMLQDPNLDMVSSYIEQFVSPDLNESDRMSVYMPSDERDGLLPSTLVVKKTFFLRVGLFDTRWNIGEVIDWHFRAQEMGARVHTVEKILARRRIHMKNKGIIYRNLASERILILKEALDRRRSAAGEENRTV